MRPFAQVDAKTGHTTYDGRFTRPGVVGNGPYVLSDSVGSAKEFVTDAIRNATSLGKGHSPLNIR